MFPVKFVKFLRTPILKNICQQINERQQETHTLSDEENESHLVNPENTVTWIRFNYLTSVALFFNFIPFDYESMGVV